MNRKLTQEDVNAVIKALRPFHQAALREDDEGGRANLNVSVEFTHAINSIIRDCEARIGDLTPETSRSNLHHYLKSDGWQKPVAPPSASSRPAGLPPRSLS